MANISPGVFTKIIDLSTFVQVVPSTIGFMCGLTRKGRDNELLFIGSRSEFISEFGEPNITEFGRNYGQGPYLAYNYLGESGALYWIRCLPDDAAYSNLQINTKLASADATASVTVTWVDGLNNSSEITDSLETSGDTKPLAILYPIGRGDYYNGIGVRFTEHSNPTLDGVYVLDIYEKQSDDEDVIIESFDVSFDPDAVDNAGDSLFIGSVLETFSSVLRADIELANGEYSDGYKLIVKNYDKEIGTTTVSMATGDSWIQDVKQDFSDWETVPETGNANYVIIAKDAKGNEAWAWMGASFGLDSESIKVYPTRNLTGASQGWNTSVGSTDTFAAWSSGATYSSGDVVLNGDCAFIAVQDHTSSAANEPGSGSSWTSYWSYVFDCGSAITYFIRESKASVASAFTSSEPVPLRKGSEGALRESDGSIDETEAELLLQQGYSGLIDDQILDPESVFFTLVFDAGYPTDVKTAISTLCQTRRDCVGIIDNGDNSSVTASLAKRDSSHPYNTYFVSIYEEYNKVSDVFTGQDIWFSPLYHMSYLLPRNDNVAEIWFAAAGFQRGAIDSIKELRFNPRLGQRDQMYLKQLNPIVKFSAGYVVWGQLTSQARPSALQDLNIVRLVLFCKRAIEQFCRFFIFEQNDPITWGQVSGAIVDFLEVIKNKRGLDSYSVEVGATDYERKTKTFHVDVILQPTRVVEKIELNFFIE